MSEAVMAPAANPGDATAPVRDDKVLEAAVLTLAKKLERQERRAGDLPSRWVRPMMILRPILDVLGAVSIGFVAANVSILLIFIIVNVLLHL